MDEQVTQMDVAHHWYMDQVVAATRTHLQAKITRKAVMIKARG